MSAPAMWSTHTPTPATHKPGFLDLSIDRPSSSVSAPLQHHSRSSTNDKVQDPTAPRRGSDSGLGLGLATECLGGMSIYGGNNNDTHTPGNGTPTHPSQGGFSYSQQSQYEQHQIKEEQQLHNGYQYANSAVTASQGMVGGSDSAYSSSGNLLDHLGNPTTNASSLMHQVKSEYRQPLQVDNQSGMFEPERKGSFGHDDHQEQQSIWGMGEVMNIPTRPPSDPNSPSTGANGVGHHTPQPYAGHVQDVLATTVPQPVSLPPPPMMPNSYAYSTGPTAVQGAGAGHYNYQNPHHHQHYMGLSTKVLYPDYAPHMPYSPRTHLLTPEQMVHHSLDHFPPHLQVSQRRNSAPTIIVDGLHAAAIGAAATAGLAGGEKKRGRHVARACQHCKKAHLACDEQRPCKRCVRLGKTDCRDVEHKRRGRPRASQNKNGPNANSTGNTSNAGTPTPQRDGNKSHSPEVQNGMDFNLGRRHSATTVLPLPSANAFATLAPPQPPVATLATPSAMTPPFEVRSHSDKGIAKRRKSIATSRGSEFAAPRRMSLQPSGPGPGVLRNQGLNVMDVQAADMSVDMSSLTQHAPTTQPSSQGGSPYVDEYYAPVTQAQSGMGAMNGFPIKAPPSFLNQAPAHS